MYHVLEPDISKFWHSDCKGQLFLPHFFSNVESNEDIPCLLFAYIKYLTVYYIRRSAFMSPVSPAARKSVLSTIEKLEGN